MPRLIKLYVTGHLASVWGLCFIAQNPEGVRRSDCLPEPLRTTTLIKSFLGKPQETSVNCVDKTKSLTPGYWGAPTLYSMFQDQRPYQYIWSGVRYSLKKLREGKRTNAIYSDKVLTSGPFVNT